MLCIIFWIEFTFSIVYSGVHSIIHRSSFILYYYIYFNVLELTSYAYDILSKADEH